MGLEISLLNVRRSIFINALPGRVWNEFATFEKISNWFGLGHKLHVFEPKLGGRVRLSVEIDGEEQFYGGPITVYEHEREVSFEVNWDGADAWPVPTIWTIRLTHLYDGTLAEIFHHGFERLGAAAADNLEGYEDGWDIKHLKALRSIIES